MSDKMVDIIIKGIPPVEMVKWVKEERQQAEYWSRWLDEHTVTINSSIADTKQKIDWEDLINLKSNLKEVIDIYSSLLTELKGLKNSLDETLKSFDKDK